MQRILKYIISENTTPVTILDFLKKEGFSRHILSSMKNTPNTIILNGERGFGRSVLKPQDHLIVTVPETESGENIIRTKMDLNIIYEDEDILVINKPADMPVHPSAGNYENTLANGIAWYFAEKGEDFVYRCINRLDRDTTGALILAKNPLSAAILSVQMKKRQILRTYLALVDGLLPDSGTINAPIARMEGSVITREVNFGTGESAITHYERLAAGKEYSLAELHLDCINNLRAEDARYISYAHGFGVCVLFPDEVRPENILFLPPAVHNELLQTPRFRNLLPW